MWEYTARWDRSGLLDEFEIPGSHAGFWLSIESRQIVMAPPLEQCPRPPHGKSLGLFCLPWLHATKEKPRLRSSSYLWPGMSPTPFNAKSHCSGCNIYEPTCLPLFCCPVGLLTYAEPEVSLPPVSGSMCGCDPDQQEDGRKQWRRCWADHAPTFLPFRLLCPELRSESVLGRGSMGSGRTSTISGVQPLNRSSNPDPEFFIPLLDKSVQETICIDMGLGITSICVWNPGLPLSSWMASGKSFNSVNFSSSSMGIIYTSTCTIYYEDEIRYLKHLECQGTCVIQELTHLEPKGILQKLLFPHSHWTDGETETQRWEGIIQS